MSFFNFIYNTFQERVNLPTIQGVPNKFYLPDVLSNIDSPDNPGQKLLPLLVDSWNLGSIPNPDGQTISTPIATWYSNFLVFNDNLPVSSTVGIVNPEQPDPSLSLSGISILGLNNVTVLPNPTVQSGTDGYTALIALNFNQIQSLPHQLGIQGEFLLQQAVCLQDTQNPGQCNGYCTNVQGTGNFEVDFTDDTCIEAQISIKVTGSGSARAIGLEIQSLNLQGQNGSTPPFTVTILDITNAPEGLETVWVQLANSAFDSDAAKTNMITNLNQTLNSEGNRNSLADTLLAQLNTGLDKIFGSIPASGLPDDSGQQVANPADLYFLDRIRAGLNNPDSNFYIPNVLLQNNNPQLEPYAAGSIDVGTQNICGLDWTPNTLSNIVISGLSNNMAPADNIVMQNQLSIITVQGQLNPLPSGVPAPPLTITGDFSFTPQGMQAITGSINCTVATSNLNLLSTASGDRIEDLVITLSQLQLQADPSQLSISLDFPDGSGLGPIVNQLVQSSNVKTTIITKINSAISGGPTLSNISAAVTNIIKNAIISELGGPI